MSLEAVATFMVGATAVIAWLGWQMVTREQKPDQVGVNWSNLIGSFFILVSINFVFAGVSTAFLIIENVPYAYLVSPFVNVINIAMWVTIAITVFYFIRMVYVVGQVMLNMLKRNARDGYGSRNG